MEPRLYRLTIVVSVVLGFYPHESHTSDNAASNPKFRLRNGLQSFEGILQILVDGQYTNICARNVTKDQVSPICRDYINNKTPTASLYEPNVFNAFGLTDGIYIENVKKPLHKNDIVQCEQVVSVCCHDPMAAVNESCSGNWTFVKYRSSKSLYKKPSLMKNNNHIYHLEVSKSKNISTFWTATAFREITNGTNSSVPDDDVTHSINDCLNKLHDFPLQLTVVNKSCDPRLTPDFDNNSRTFELTDNMTDTNIFLCVSATMTLSNWTLRAEECNTTHRDIGFYERKYKETTTKRLEPTSNRGSSTPTPWQTTAKNMKHSDVKSQLPTWSLVILGSVPVVLVIIVVVVCCVLYRIRKLKQCHQAEGQHNCMTNKTYGSKMVLNRSNSAEDYTDIMDCELVDLSADKYKPDLPSRRRGSDVIELDSYSTPLDTIGNTVHDEYSITYDDPIRMHHSPCQRRKSGSQSNRSKKKSTLSGSEKINETKSESQRHSVEVSNAYVAVHSANDINTADNDSKDEKIPNSKRVSEYEIVASKESIAISTNKDSDGDESRSNHSDYEITDITNDEDSKTKHNNLNEHVCLDCLTSEHLKSLGISIVPDDNYYLRCKDLTKRFSAPCPTSGNSGEIDMDNDITKCSTGDKGVRVSNDNRKSLCSRGSGTCTELKSSRRKCSVCHSDYDRLGKFNRSDLFKYTDNVYEKLGHVHARRHVVGKRINST